MDAKESRTLAEEALDWWGEAEEYDEQAYDLEQEAAEYRRRAERARAKAMGIDIQLGRYK